MIDPIFDTFIAEDDGPPGRRFWIYRDPCDGRNDTVRGWNFVFAEVGPDGAWQVGWDTWEQWFFEILRYPTEYASKHTVWRRESSGEVVNLQDFQPFYDGR